ncbi:MAG: hypothetical protein LBG24_12375 [Treponema sp.]|jgi:hypothetical protein|nr:hypothetical protein [Treponema sp.]
MAQSPLRLLVAAVFFSLWGPLFAGEVTSTVRGADLDIPLEGAVIHSWDGEEYLCDEDGRAMLPVPQGRQVIPVTGTKRSRISPRPGLLILLVRVFYNCLSPVHN